MKGGQKLPVCAKHKKKEKIYSPAFGSSPARSVKKGNGRRVWLRSPGNNDNNAANVNNNGNVNDNGNNVNNDNNSARPDLLPKPEINSKRNWSARGAKEPFPVRKDEQRGGTGHRESYELQGASPRRERKTQ